MIDYFSGVDTDFFLLGRGEHCVLPWKACNGELLLLLGQASHQYFITQGRGQSSMGRVGGEKESQTPLLTMNCNLVVEILEGGGGEDNFESNIPGPSPSLYEACLKNISGS